MLNPGFDDEEIRNKFWEQRLARARLRLQVPVVLVTRPESHDPLCFAAFEVMVTAVLRATWVGTCKEAGTLLVTYSLSTFLKWQFGPVCSSGCFVCCSLHCPLVCLGALGVLYLLMLGAYVQPSGSSPVSFLRGDCCDHPVTPTVTSAPNTLACLYCHLLVRKQIKQSLLIVFTS